MKFKKILSSGIEQSSIHKELARISMAISVSSLPLAVKFIG